MTSITATVHDAETTNCPVTITEMTFFYKLKFQYEQVAFQITLQDPIASFENPDPNEAIVSTQAFVNPGQERNEPLALTVSLVPEEGQSFVLLKTPLKDDNGFWQANTETISIRRKTVMEELSKQKLTLKVDVSRVEEIEEIEESNNSGHVVVEPYRVASKFMLMAYAAGDSMFPPRVVKGSNVDCVLRDCSSDEIKAIEAAHVELYKNFIKKAKENQCKRILLYNFDGRTEETGDDCDKRSILEKKCLQLAAIQSGNYGVEYFYHPLKDLVDDESVKGDALIEQEQDVCKVIATHATKWTKDDFVIFHCSASKGRTGLFIAAIEAITDDDVKTFLKKSQKPAHEAVEKIQKVRAVLDLTLNDPKVILPRRLVENKALVLSAITQLDEADDDLKASLAKLEAAKKRVVDRTQSRYISGQNGEMSSQQRPLIALEAAAPFLL